MGFLLLVPALGVNPSERVNLEGSTRRVCYLLRQRWDGLRVARAGADGTYIHIYIYIYIYIEQSETLLLA